MAAYRKANTDKHERKADGHIPQRKESRGIPEANALRHVVSAAELDRMAREGRFKSQRKGGKR